MRAAPVPPLRLSREVLRTLRSQRLAAAAAVELHVYPGAPHGFDGFWPRTGVAHRARRDVRDWLGRQLAS